MASCAPIPCVCCVTTTFLPLTPHPSAAIEPHSVFNIYRHYSLPALDTRRFKSQSVPTSPIHNKHHQHAGHRHQHIITRQQSSPSPTPQSMRQQSPIPERREPPSTPPPSPIRPLPVFSLGGEVTAALQTPPSPTSATKSATTASGEQSQDAEERAEVEEEVVDAPTRRNRCVYKCWFCVV